MIPVPGIYTASCGNKLTSEFRDFVIDKFAHSVLAMVQLTQKQVLLAILLCLSLSFISSRTLFQLNNSG